MENNNHQDQGQDYTDWFDEVLKELTQVGHTHPLTEEEYDLITNIWDHFDMSPAEAAQLFSKMFPAEPTRPLPVSLIDSLQEPALQAQRLDLRRKLATLPLDSLEFTLIYAEIKKVTGLITLAVESDRLVLQQFIPRPGYLDSDSQEG